MPRPSALLRSTLGPMINLSGAMVALWEPLWSFAVFLAAPVIYFLQPPSGRGRAR